MRVQYVMINFDPDNWDKWKKLYAAEQKKFKEEFKKKVFKRLDQGTPNKRGTPWR